MIPRESPQTEGTTLRLKLLKRTKVVPMTRNTGGTVSVKVRWKVTEKRSERKEYLALFFFNSFCCFAFSFIAQCHAL